MPGAEAIDGEAQHDVIQSLNRHHWRFQIFHDHALGNFQLQAG